MVFVREGLKGIYGGNEESCGEGGLWVDLHNEHVTVFVVESSSEVVVK